MPSLNKYVCCGHINIVYCFFNGDLVYIILISYGTGLFVGKIQKMVWVYSDDYRFND